MKKSSFKIVLIGPELEENLSLRYLAGSLEDAAYSNVTIIPYNNINEATGLVKSLVDEQPDLIGISMAFQARIIEDLTLVKLLKKGGYSGHITTGGQFVTLHYKEVFEDCKGLDSAILFEGEKSLVELADAIREKSSLEEVKSLVWKDSSGELVKNGSATHPDEINKVPLPIRKINAPEFLGLKTSHLVGSRGCHATCSYCCVAALAKDRRDAARESGGTTAIPGTRRRTPVHVANEIAHLYHQSGVRIFEFEDDNWIPPKPSWALEYFLELEKELELLAVGQIGLTVKMRADAVVPETIKVLKRIGLIRVFVGIESGTQTLLSKLGRKSREDISLNALDTLRSMNISAYFNALLFGPDLSHEDLEPELQFLEKSLDFSLEVVEVVIYGRTSLHRKLEEQNRLTGNYLAYDYQYKDKRLQTIYEIVRKMDTRHFGVYAPIKMAADLGFNLGILRVFYPSEKVNYFEAQVAHYLKEINVDQIAMIRRAMKVYETAIPIELSAELLARDAAKKDLEFYRELMLLQQEMEEYVNGYGGAEREVKSYYRGGIIKSGMVASVLALAVNSGYATSINDAVPDKYLQADSINLQQDSLYSGLEEVLKGNDEDWKEIKAQLRNSKTSIDAVIDKLAIAYNTDRGSYRDDAKKVFKDLVSILDKRRDDDVKVLREVIVEASPKLKITGDIFFTLDSEGNVTDVSAGRGTELGADVKKTILEILKDKQFKANEVIHQILLDGETKHKEYELVHNSDPADRIIQRKKKYRYHRRYGPLD